MLGVSDKQRLRRILFSKISLLLLLVLVVVFVRGTWGVYQKARFAKENRLQAEQELNELEQRASSLRTEMQRLETERGLEEEIRHSFDVGRDGEHLIILVDAPEQEAAARETSQSLWQRVISFFGFDE